MQALDKTVSRRTLLALPLAGFIARAGEAQPPRRAAAPVVTALAYAPNSATLAISGYREALLYKADGSELVTRLPVKFARIETLAYSPDGKILAVSGGNPSRTGEVEFWDATTNTLLNSANVAPDSLFGAAFSPDGKSLSAGCADNAVRVVSVPDGKVKLKFDNHSDWTFATTWATDNKHLLSTGRDRAVKLIVAENGSFVDDINTHTSPYRAMSRHPKEDRVLVAGDDGIARIYQVFRTKPRTMNQEDHNLLAEFERQSAQVNAVAWSPDGALVVLGGEADAVNVYRVSDKTKAASLKGHRGTVHAVAFRPDGQQVATAGFDGAVRLYEVPSGKLAREWLP